MKKQKNIDLLIAFQLYLYNKGLIVNHDWNFEKQAKKFLKSCIREADKIDEKVVVHFELNAAAAYESFTKLNDQFAGTSRNNWPPYKTHPAGIKHPLDIDNPLPFVTFEKSEQEVMDEFKSVINNTETPEGFIDLNDYSETEQHHTQTLETGKGRRLYSKCNRGDVIRSYVEESNLNKGEYVLVIQCRNGRKFIVAGNHYTPTYLQPYDQSFDMKKANNEK